MDLAKLSSTAAPVEIAFGSDAGYLQPLTISISSVITSARQPERLRFWLITKSLDAAALVPLRTMIEDAGAQLEVRSPIADTSLEAMPLGAHFTEATYYRLMMPQVLPTSVTKLIYLDSDVI